MDPKRDKKGGEGAILFEKDDPSLSVRTLEGGAGSFFNKIRNRSSG